MDQQINKNIYIHAFSAKIESDSFNINKTDNNWINSDLAYDKYHFDIEIIPKYNNRHVIIELDTKLNKINSIRTSPIQIKRIIFLISSIIILASVIGIILPFPWNLSSFALAGPISKIFGKVYKKLK